MPIRVYIEYGPKWVMSLPLKLRNRGANIVGDYLNKELDTPEAELIVALYELLSKIEKSGVDIVAIEGRKEP